MLLARMMSLFLILIYCSIMVAGQLLFRASSSSLGGGNGQLNISDLLLRREFILALGLYAVSTVLWVAILSKLDLSAAYPLVVGLTTGALILIDKIAFNRNIDMTSLLGAFLITAGVILVSNNAGARP
jgi:multidrug transporter EmrE-like cation transporter